VGVGVSGRDKRVAPRAEENGGGDVWYKELKHVVKHHNVCYIDHKIFPTRCVNIWRLDR